MGQESDVLFESDNSNGFMHGFTGNYIKVSTPFDPGLANQIKKVKLENLNDDMTYIVKKEDLFGLTPRPPLLQERG
jgi:hypothetical protein